MCFYVLPQMWIFPVDLTTLSLRHVGKSFDGPKNVAIVSFSGLAIGSQDVR
jgi:hypothetical protein